MKHHKVIGAFILCCSIIGMPYFFIQTSAYFHTYIYFNKSSELVSFPAVYFLAHCVSFFIVKIFFRNYFSIKSLKSKYFTATCILAFSYYMQKYFSNPIIFAVVTGIATGLNSGMLLAHNISNIIQKYETKYKAIILGAGLMASTLAPSLMKLLFVYMANPNNTQPSLINGYYLYPQEMVNGIINAIDCIFLIGILLYFAAYWLSPEDFKGIIKPLIELFLADEPKSKLALQFSVPVALHNIALIMTDIFANTISLYGFGLGYSESTITTIASIILFGSGIMAFLSSVFGIYSKEKSAIKLVIALNVY